MVGGGGGHGSRAQEMEIRPRKSHGARPTSWKQPEFRIPLLRKLRRRRRPGMNFATAGTRTGGTAVVRRLPGSISVSVRRASSPPAGSVDR